MLVRTIRGHDVAKERWKLFLEGHRLGSGDSKRDTPALVEFHGTHHTVEHPAGLSIDTFIDHTVETLAQLKKRVKLEIDVAIDAKIAEGFPYTKDVGGETLIFSLAHQENFLSAMSDATARIQKCQDMGHAGYLWADKDDMKAFVFMTVEELQTFARAAFDYVQELRAMGGYEKINIDDPAVGAATAELMAATYIARLQEE